MTELYSLLEQAVNKTSSWATIIMFPKKKLGVLECGPNVGIPEDWAHITNALDETTGNGRSYLTGKPALIENVTIEQPDGGATYHYMSAIAVVPILKNGLVIATLETIKDKKNAIFTSEEVKTLEEIADKLTKYI